MMGLVMDVIDGTTVWTNTGNPHRKYKQTYISFLERNDVRVIVHRGSDWGGGYNNYDWIVVTAYPQFVPDYTY